MNYSATLCRVVLSTLITIVISGLASAGVHDDYKTPLFTIPYAATPPTIDGSIDDAQWQNALSINALQTTEGNISSRQARVWMMWDADNLYLAMRSPLRPGEKVLQATRDRGRDNVKTVFDDAYEIFLNFGTRSPNGEIVFFQYLGNVAGAKYDVMFEPTVGNSRPGWESGWKPKNRITPDGKFWEMTVAIPRQSVYMNTPFADGMQIQGLFVRDFKRPWEQNSIGGSGSFSVPETHCKFILSKSAPVIQLLDVADVKNQTFGANVTILPRVTERIKFSVTSDNGGKTTSDEIQVAGQRVWLENRLNLGLPGKGYYRITIKNGDESKTYLDWCSKLAFGDLSATTQPIHDTDDKADLSLSFNPVKNYVRVEGDFINYANRGSIARYAAQVLDSNGKQLAQKDLTLDNLAYVHGLMQLGDCPPGSYTARLTCYDAGGKQVLAKETSFEKKDAAKEYPWWNTTAGNIEKVLDPWTPMKDEGGKIDVWGRTMTVGAAGLPSQVTTQGSEILASPMSLVAETAAGSVAATSESIKTTEQSDHRIITQTTAKLGDLSVATKTTAEFDGMYKVQMTITPQKSTSVKSLKVVIPINPAFAEYTNACGEGIRYGFSYGYLPKDKTGPLWSSKQVDGQPMLVGSFIPYVWIGNEHGGLCWFANSDEGWMPNDNVPGIEIRRDSPASVNLVLNLISSDSTIDAPRNITFAFQATPVKPIRAGWRMDTWSTADSFKDFCCVEPKGGHLIWNALPFTLDNAGCIKKVEERHKMDNNYNFGIIKNYHANAVPYFENNGIDKNFAPEVAYFGDQWRARVSDSSAYDKTLQDFIVYNLGKWARECNIDGWYVDNVRPVADDNIDAGRGYKLPDGRIQPSYLMFDTREFFLRVRAMFAENGKSGKFVLHMTNHMMMPWVGAADLALDGEDHVTFPDMGKDFIDFWSPERMRLDYPAQSGVGVTFLQEYQGNWNHTDLKRAIRAYTAMCILNDVMPSANPNGDNQEVWRGRDRFGIEGPTVKFVPYWDTDNGVTVTGTDVLASFWRKPGSVLIAVVDRGEATTATVNLDLTKLGLSASSVFKVVDADTGDEIEMRKDGSIKIPVNRHDYRQLLIQAN